MGMAETEEQEERRQMHEFRCEVAANVRIVALVVEMNEVQRQTLLAAADALTEVGVQS